MIRRIQNVLNGLHVKNQNYDANDFFVSLLLAKTSGALISLQMEINTSRVTQYLATYCRSVVETDIVFKLHQ